MSNYDILMRKLDDNKYEGHSNAIWKLNPVTLRALKMDYTVCGMMRRYEKAPPTILGLGYEIDRSMQDGEIELDNSPPVRQTIKNGDKNE